MAKILVIDNLTIVRDLISACLRHEGYETLAVAGGPEALSAVRSFPPDLIVFDQNLPGVDGLSTLRSIRGMHGFEQIPVILLTATSDKNCVVGAAKLGVRNYLLKTVSSLDSMLARIRHCLGAAAGPAIPALNSASTNAATKTPTKTETLPDQKLSQDAPANAAPTNESVGNQSAPQNQDPAVEALAKAMGVPRLLTREQCMERAELALQGKALSGVVAQVIQLAASPRSETAQIADSISHDPMLTAKVLRVANSAVYATSRGPVTTIADAIKKIGLSVVRNIATAVGVFEALPASGDKGAFDPIRCWQHSFAVAMLTETLAADPEDPHSGLAAVGYLAGLCHDLGEILFRTCFEKEYTKVLEAHASLSYPIADVEKAMLGMPSSELIRVTLRCLGLPDAIREPIEKMHNPAPTQDRLALILRFADIYANGMLMASSTKAPVRSFSVAECEQALGKNATQSLHREKICAEIFALTALLSQGNDPGLTKPLFAKTQAKIWLAREPGLSKLDPVEAALAAMARVEVRNRLPSPDEVNEIKAIAVEARAASSPGFTGENISALQAGCKAKLRTLWLVNECDTSTASATAQGASPIAMPLPLDALATFLLAA